MAKVEGGARLKMVNVITKIYKEKIIWEWTDGEVGWLFILGPIP